MISKKNLQFRLKILFIKRSDAPQKIAKQLQVENHCIRGEMFSLLSNYLNKRKQFTICNDAKSNIGSVLCGVPQGITLKPFALFFEY